MCFWQSLPAEVNDVHVCIKNNNFVQVLFLTEVQCRTLYAEVCKCFTVWTDVWSSYRKADNWSWSICVLSSLQVLRFLKFRESSVFTARIVFDMTEAMNVRTCVGGFAYGNVFVCVCPYVLEVQPRLVNRKMSRAVVSSSSTLSSATHHNVSVPRRVKIIIIIIKIPTYIWKLKHSDSASHLHVLTNSWQTPLLKSRKMDHIWITFHSTSCMISTFVW